VFNYCFTAIIICRLPWPWDACLLERRQYRASLGNACFWRQPITHFTLFSFLFSPYKPLFCPQSLLESIHCFCWAFHAVCTTKSSIKDDRLTVTSVSELETDWRLALCCFFGLVPLPWRQQPFQTSRSIPPSLICTNPYLCLPHCSAQQLRAFKKHFSSF